MHRALEEDVRTIGHQFPDTPGFAFVTLNDTKVDQAFRSWVLLQAHFISELLVAYCSAHGRQLDITQLQSRYLFKPPDIDSIYLFAYAVARLLQIDKTPVYALQSSFAGQLEMNLLFDISLVIDSTIKFKNQKEWRFIDHISLLSRKGNLGLNKNKLKHLNKIFQNDFDGTSLSKLGADLAVTYGLRNYGAHKVTSISTIYLQFKEIRQKLINTLFFAVELLY